MELVAQADAAVRTLNVDEARGLHGSDGVIFIDLRDRYGIAAPAPFCPPDRAEGKEGEDVSCQALEAPSQPGARLVEAQTLGSGGAATRDCHLGLLDPDDGIRLTYRELTALIADAVKQLR